MSSRSPHRQAATFVLAPETAKEVTVHGELVTDASYTSANRIEIFGTDQDKIKCMGLIGERLIPWRLYDDKGWSQNQEGEVSTVRSGTCYPISVSAPVGRSIEESAIKSIAQFRIFEYKEINIYNRDASEIYTFSFLPCPEMWHPYSGLKSFENRLEKHGRWKKISGTNLKFRRWIEGEIIRDDRVFDGEFIIWAPLVEIQKNPADSQNNILNFTEISEYMQIAIMFIYSIHTSPLSSEDYSSAGCVHTQFPLRASREKIKDKRHNRLPFGKTEDLIAKTTEYLINNSEQKSALYASVFKYVESINGSAIESQLVSCVEALESLVNIYEKNMGWSRDSVERRKWQKARRDFKVAIDQCEAVSAEVKQAAHCALIYPPKIDLQERIVRAISSQRGRWNPSSLPVREKVKHIVQRRNKIVHGEILDDPQESLYCIMQSQFIFENLFCNLVRHSYRPGAGWWIVGDWRPE